MANEEVLKIIVAAEDAATNVLRNIGASLKELGGAATMAGAAIGAAVAYKSVKAFADFDQALQESIAIMGDVDAAMREKLEERAREVARTMAVSHEEAAKSYYYLASAGLSAAESLEAMPKVARLAEAAAIDMAEATDYATDIMTAFGYSVEDLGYINDVLIATVTKANTDLPMLADAMKYVASVANTAGVSITETSAAIGLLSNAGIKGSMAGTGLRRIITTLIAPTGKAAEIMDTLGITMEDVDLKTHSLADVIQLLKDRGATSADIMEMFGQRGGAAMLALMNQGVPALRALEEELGNSEGITEEVAKTQEETLNNQLEILRNNLNDIAISVGEALVPALNQLVGLIRQLFEAFNALPEPMKQVITQGIAFGSVALAVLGVIKALSALAGMLGAGGALATAAGALGTIATSVGTALGAIAAAVSLPVLAIGALVAAIVALVFNIGGARDKLVGILRTIYDAFAWLGGQIKEKISEAFGAVIDFIVELPGKLKEKAIEIGRAIIEGIKEGLKNLWETLKSILIEPINKAVDWVKDKLGIGSPSKVFREIGRGIVEGYKGGLEKAKALDLELPMPKLTPPTPAPMPTMPMGNNVNITIKLEGVAIRQDEDIDRLAEEIERRLGRKLRW